MPLDSKEKYIEWMKSNANSDEKYLPLRWDRLQQDIKWGYKTDPRVMRAFLMTPRELFCREKNLDKAYDHNYLVIGYGQTISGPHIVIRMTNVINPEKDMKVLEIGTGSGYQSALLSELCDNVYTIEVIKPLAEETDKIYTKNEDKYPKYKKIVRKAGDGYYGWEEHSPFDRIIVTCGIDHIPPDLLKQLKPDGIMVIPVGPYGKQVVLKVTKRVDKDGKVTIDREDIYKGRTNINTAFVPLLDEKGKIHKTPK